MFSSKRLVFLKDTDATGVIYFTSLLQYSLEAFELFLLQEDVTLSHFLSKGYLFPIVHAESDYKAPLKVGDEILVHLHIGVVSKRSFSVEAEIRRLSDGVLAGSTKIIHAFLLKGAEVSSELPQEIVSLLEKRLDKG